MCRNIEIFQAFCDRVITAYEPLSGCQLLELLNERPFPDNTFASQHNKRYDMRLKTDTQPLTGKSTMVSRCDCANAIRILAVDAVQKANSGHPGMPMGMADIAEVLWRDHLRYNPQNPQWVNRDRFVLSNGHGAMLQYALLHLSGFDLSMNDIKQFRQLGSKTPGHPEFGHTPGVETTTGPLGQGLANAVGMALAETRLAAEFNRQDFPIIDNYTYVFMGDGCLMEGISHEACSLAGTWKLGKLIAFWDDNGISIDGEVQPWFSDDTAKRFEAYGWQVIQNVDGHNHQAIDQAIQQAKAVSDKPSLICCRTEIGHGSPNRAGTAASHGAPLGDEEIALTRKALGWHHAPFDIPDDIYRAWDARERGQQLEADWNQRFSAYKAQHPVLSKAFLRRMNGELPDKWLHDTDIIIQDIQDNGGDVATRKASLQTLNAYSKMLPELIGGSADLSGSNCTDWVGSTAYSAEQRDGNYIYYGVREFAMSAIMNGIALSKGGIPFAGTFLTFSDYARNAVRLAALMKQRVIFVYTHDSIGLGEDGPTHQPVEQLSSLRIIPGLDVWRPCDDVETHAAWQQAIHHHQRPSCILLSRQNVTHQPRHALNRVNMEKGGYILRETHQTCHGILMASGSEIEIAIEVAKKLEAQCSYWRVVSMACCEVFKRQDAHYREIVLPPTVVRRIAIEAGSSDYWHQFVGNNGVIVGIDEFGASAPAGTLFKEYGFTVDNVLNKAHHLLENVEQEKFS